jgi:predicted transcriptional regulator
MSTLEIKKELHELIDKGDAATIKGFYNMLKNYINQIENDKKIAEAEADIKAGRIISHSQVKDIIASWKE